MAPADREVCEALMSRLALGLHGVGVPSHRLERALDALAQSLGVQATFLITPTSIMASFGGPVRMLRVEPGQAHLERLDDLYSIILGLQQGDTSPKDAHAALDELAKQPERYGRTITVAAFALTSATAALLFGGGAHDALGATAIGLVIGLVTMFAGPTKERLGLLPVICGLLAAVGSQALATYAPPAHAFVIMLASLIVLIPGLTLTIAINELAHQHLISGTGRLMGAAMLFLQLGFGCAIGWTLGPDAQAAASPAPPAWSWLAPFVAIPLVAGAFVVLFRARPAAYPSILLGSTVAFGSATWASTAMGPEAGMAIGAWSLGCFSNLTARLSQRPSAISLLPGLLLLVPGSMGIQSLEAMLNDDVLLGVESAFRMALLATALVTGLLVANLTIRPRSLAAG